MTKKRLILVLAIIFLLGTITYAVAIENSPTKKGAWIGSSVQEFFVKEDSAKTYSLNNNTEDSNRVIGYVLGEEITAHDFELKARLYELSGSETPGLDAWNTIKLQTYKKQFAESVGIYPTYDEIVAFTQEMRQLVESSSDGKSYAKALLDAAGMTEDEYWNEYKVKKESPAHLTDIKISEYLAENNLPEWNTDKILANIDAEIIDADIKTKYNL